ncbi:MAG: Ig-like domain-containing protein, partial [Bacteroidota bacterium]|nr:Ig-like domain-containing protein [Bacteroidota bacterium]
VNGCTSSVGMTTATVNAIPSTPTASNNGPVCAGSTLSLSTPTVSGAIYSWTGPNSFSSGLQNPSIASTTSAASGTYSVTVTVNDCTSSAGTTTTTVNAITASSAAGTTSLLCNGNTTTITVTASSAAGATSLLCNGNTTTITVTASGGTGTLQYSLDGTTYQSGNTFTVGAGTYGSITVKDASNCTKVTNSISITEPTAITASSAAGTTSVLCNGNTTTITVTASGGTGTLQYSLDGTTYQSGNTFTVGAGIYGSITVKDANNCTKVTNSIAITEPAAIMSLGASSKTNATCFGTSTGTVIAGIVNNAVGAVTYTWKNGSNTIVGTTSTILNLPVGTYTLTVSDNCNVRSNSVTISEPSMISISSTTVPVTCKGKNDGSINLTVSGGTPPYSYSWTGPGSYSATTEDISAIPGGTYNVSVTDFKGCIKIESYIVVYDNNKPLALNDKEVINEDQPLVSNVYQNDLPSCDGGNVWRLINAPSHGTLLFNSDGSFTYKPNTDYTGSDSFTYSVCDVDNECSNAEFKISIIPVNDSPIAKNDINTTFRDRAVSGNLLTNDSDPEGDILTVKTTAITSPVNGTVVILSNGNYTYTPKPGFTGSDSFVYEVCDNGNPSLCDQATVSIEVIEETISTTNHPPVALHDAYQGSIGFPVRGSVLNNDFDVDGNLNPNSVTLVGSAPLSGSLTLNPNGTFTYVPTVSFIGQVTFDYRVCDLATPSLCDGARVIIDILPNPTGNSTYASDDTFYGKEDLLLTGNVLVNDNDPQGDTQTVNSTPLISPSHGTLILNSNGAFTFTPAPNYVGQDQFVYEVCDSGSPVACDQATVYLIVEPFNDAPVAKDDINTTFKDRTVSGNLLTNDSDPEGDILTVKTTAITSPVSGTVVILSNGSYTYTPKPGYTGSDSFVYEVCDNGSPTLCDQATVSIEVIEETISTTNHPPVALHDAYQGSIGLPVRGSVLNNDFDVDGNLNPNSVTLVGSAPLSGSLTLNPNGTFTYVPTAGFIGQVTFDYRVCDLGAPSLCDGARVIIDILPNPTGNSTYASDDTFYGKEDLLLTGNVLVNDNDPQGDTQAVNRTPVISPAHGTLVLNSNGAFTFTPAPNYVGQDQFVYEVCDNGSPVACDQATVYLILGQDDDQPMAADDINTTNEDNSVTGNVKVNDLISNDGLNVWSIVKQPNHGRVVMVPDGSYTFTPDADYYGSDSFIYKLCDIDGDCDEARVTITVNPVDDQPVANDDLVSIFIDGVLDDFVGENDLPSGDGGNVWTLVTSPLNGKIIFNMDGSYSYTPNPNFSGNDTFIYKVCDVDGDCAQATVTITIEDIILPNQVLTPNGDGKNDTFYIVGIEFYPANRLTIYNRWGNVVYQKSGYQNEWDGYSNKNKVGNTSLPVGTYFYVLDYGIQKHKTGYVYLER